LTQEQGDPESWISPSELKAPARNKLADLLDLLLLSRLWIKPVGGYQLRNDLWKEFGIRVSFGTLYPYLKNLERTRFVFLEESQADHKMKKIYRLTPSGMSALKFNVVAIVKIANTLRPILDSK